MLLNPGHILLWFQSPWCAQSSAAEILLQLSMQLRSVFLPNTTQNPIQLLFSKHVGLLTGTIRFSSKCCCDQFVCLRRERSSHCSLDNKSSQVTHERSWFSHCHSLRKLACHFPLLCIQRRKEKCWLSSSSSCFLVMREDAEKRRVLSLVKAQHSCFCAAPHYLFNSWGTPHWNESVALWWESFHNIIRSRKQEIYRERQSFFIPLTLLCLSLKHKYTFTHTLKPASELQHVERNAALILASASRLGEVSATLRS